VGEQQTGGGKRGGGGSRGVGEGEAGDERGRGWADGVDLRKRVDGADSLKAEPGRQATPCSLNVVVV
jgi:hypothetical protein